MRIREIAVVTLTATALAGWAGAGRMLGDLRPDTQALASPEPTTRPATLPSTLPSTRPAQAQVELLPVWIEIPEIKAQ